MRDKTPTTSVSRTLVTDFADVANGGFLSSSERELAAQKKRMMEIEKAKRMNEGGKQAGSLCADLGQQQGTKRKGDSLVTSTESRMTGANLSFWEWNWHEIVRKGGYSAEDARSMVRGLRGDKKYSRLMRRYENWLSDVSKAGKISAATESLAVCWDSTDDANIACMRKVRQFFLCFFFLFFIEVN